MKDKSKAKANPLPITTKRLFFDMMDAAVAGGMPCARINLVHDAIRAMEAALTAMLACQPAFDQSATHDGLTICEALAKARKAHHDWIGGNHEKA
jgi:hypothetical protein